MIRLICLCSLSAGIVVGLAGLVCESTLAESSLPQARLGVEANQERAALIALYQSASGDHWINKGGWKDEPTLPDGFNEDPCQQPRWFGVTCSEGKVTELVLSKNGLNGQIPEDLGSLTNLICLDLSSNPLQGAIPPALGDLANLEALFLHYDWLSGPVPVELANLTRLRYGVFEGNRLQGPIPPELGNLSNLVVLSFSQNQLSGSIPPTLKNLVNLEGLYLNENDLTGAIPETLGQLSKLKQFWLSFNHLSGSIPETFGGLTSLEQLALQGNELSGPFPAQLGQLSNVKVINLRHNWLQGPIPVQFALPPSLEHLFLSGNRLSGEVPAELATLPAGRVDLRHNRLNSGQVSAQLNRAQAGEVDWRVSQRVVAVYPQLAIGGGFQVIVTISNLEPAPWMGRGYLNGGLWAEDSTWTLDGEDQTGRPDFEIDLAPFATRRFVIGAGLNAVAGWLLIRAEDGFSPANVAVSFFYNLSDQEGLLDSTGVDGSPLAEAFFFPIERSSSGVDTGVAVRGANGDDVYYWFEEAGGEVGDLVIIPGDGARLLRDILPSLPDDFVGSLWVYGSDSAFYATALRLEPHKDGGIQLTSVPPISSEGRQQRQ